MSQEQRTLNLPTPEEQSRRAIWPANQVPSKTYVRWVVAGAPLQPPYPRIDLPDGPSGRKRFVAADRRWPNPKAYDEFVNRKDAYGYAFYNWCSFEQFLTSTPVGKTLNYELDPTSENSLDTVTSL